MNLSRLSLLTFSIVLLVQPLSFTVAHAASGGTFSDVSPTNPNNTAIETLHFMHIIDGFPDGTFQPNLYVNRAEALKMIMGSTMTNIPATTTSGFPDVQASEWFAKYVVLAKDKNIISGYPDGTFRGAELINFGEILKMTFRSFGLVATTSYSEASLRVNFPGHTGKEWYLPYMMYAKEKNMLLLDEPGAYPSRAQIAELLYRIITIQKFQIDTFKVENVPLYTSLSNALSTEKNIISNSFVSVETSPLLSGKNLSMLSPFILQKDILTHKEESIALLNDLINETDVIHTLLNDKASKGVSANDFESQIISIKNSLASLKNQLINKTVPFTTEETHSFLTQTLTARKDIVKLYGSVELASAKAFASQKLLLDTFKNYATYTEYIALQDAYTRASNAVTSAEQKLTTINATTDEFAVLADVMSQLTLCQTAADDIQKISSTFMQKING